MVRETSLIGSIGVLTIATRGPAGPGEVLVKIRGGSETYIAWSPEPLPKGATVLVIESREPGPWTSASGTDPLAPFPMSLSCSKTGIRLAPVTTRLAPPGDPDWR